MIALETALAILEKPTSTTPELEQAVIGLAAELRAHLILGRGGIVEEWSLEAPEIEGALCLAVERLAAAEQADHGLREAA